MMKHEWYDLEAWGTRELIERVLMLEKVVEKMEKLIAELN